MKKSRRLSAWLLILSLILTLVAGCTDVQNTTDPSQTEAPGTDKNYGSIGTMNGMQYDEKYGNLISPYTRCKVSLESGATTFQYLDGKGKQIVGSSEQVKTSFADNVATVTQTWEAGKELTTSFTACDDGTMDIVQTMKADEGGISGVTIRFTVPMRYNVIIPAWDGICLNADHPEIYDKRTTLNYPREWQAQMLLIQGTNGGILIHANDDGTQFKSLNITNDGENFFIDITTIPQAPFTDYTEFETVVWSIKPYEGTWMDGTLLYKAYANETFKLSEINIRQPEWVEDVQLVWMDDLDSKEKLDLLAKEVNPAQTMIYIGGFRAADYDTEYPNYDPKPGIVDMIQYAKSLGFKIILHCNMIGCSFTSEEWENGLKDAASLDAYTQEVIVEGYTAFGKDYRFGQINQASVAWQDLMVETMVELVRVTGVDAIHLDQSLLCFNDGRGYVNGMTSMQGNVEMQRKLAEALPGIAFSGEGINEYNMRYADFLQQHVYGLDSNAKTWNDKYFDQIVPIVSVLFDEYAKVYHYPAYPTADKENEEYLQAWYRAGDVRAGHIPCLYRESVKSLLEPTETFTMLLNDARFRMANRPVINTGKWSDKAVMSYVLKDGTIAEWINTDKDTKFYPDITTGEATTTFVHSTTSYETDREITDWVLYDDTTLYGLLTNKTYYLSSKVRNNNATHITFLEDNLTTRGFITNGSYTAIAFDEIIPSNKILIDMLNYAGQMRAGEILFDGRNDSVSGFNTTQTFWHTMKNQGQVRHMGDRIMFHPPWIDESQDLGYSWYEVDVPLEVVGNATFSASFQLATAESAAGSNGVVFKVFAWDQADTEKKNVISQEVFCTSEIALPVSMDLTQFEGKTVTIRIECHTAGAPRNDSCHMVAPKVEQKTGKVERQITYSVKTSSPVTGIMSLHGTATYEDKGGNNYAITSEIGDVVWLLHKPEAVKNETDMTVYPFISTWQMDSGEAVAPTGDLKPQQQVAESHYELRNGIFQHPPQNGSSELSYLVTLPKSGNLQFVTSMAMKKGSARSDGVTFRVLINGQEVFAKEKQGVDGFEELTIDLNQYAGQTIVITLVTDSGDTSAYDYAFWGDPLIYTK